MKFLKIFYIFIVSNIDCGASDVLQSIGRVINGRKVLKNAYPWVAGMILSESDFLTCGGTIISDRIILTAGKKYENCRS